jgi:hypothetical protein
VRFPCKKFQIDVLWRASASLALYRSSLDFNSLNRGFMSGAKSASYRVISPEELRRRALLAAQSRLSRLEVEAANLKVDVAGIRSAYDANFNPEIAITRPLSGDPVDWEYAADALQSKLQIARQSCGSVVSAARSRQLLEMFSAVVGAKSDGLPKVFATPPQKERAANQLDALVSRIPGTASVEEVNAIRMLIDNASGQSSDQLVLRLRYEVQLLCDRDIRREKNRLSIERLLQKIDGFEDREVREMRGYLKGLDLSIALDNEIDRSVEQLRVKMINSQDEIFVENTAARILSELGYEVGDDFVTAIPVGGALLDIPSRSRHGLRVRSRNGQLLFNVVRFDTEGRRDPGEDTATEVAFCHDFKKLQEEMRRRGVDLDLVRADPPGARPVEVVSVRSRSMKPRKEEESVSKARSRRRDRG